MLFAELVVLKDLFPKAAAQVQHLLVSACSSGTQDNIEDIFVKAFPNLRTLWGYYGACPLTGGPHIAEWLKETSRKTGIPVGKLVRQQLENARSQGGTQRFLRHAGEIRGGPVDVSSRKGFSRS